MSKLSKDEYWWILLLEGLIQLGLGLLLLFSTDITVFLLVQLVGIYWLIRGIIMIVRVFVTKEKNKDWALLGGILGIISGFIVLRYPIFSGFIMLEFLVALIAFVGIVQGSISLMNGLASKGVGQVLLGVVMWIICLMLLFNLLGSAIALPFVIGIIWVISGIVLTITALKIER